MSTNYNVSGTRITDGAINTVLAGLPGAIALTPRQGSEIVLNTATNKWRGTLEAVTTKNGISGALLREEKTHPAQPTRHTFIPIDRIVDWNLQQPTGVGIAVPNRRRQDNPLDHSHPWGTFARATERNDRISDLHHVQEALSVEEACLPQALATLLDEQANPATTHGGTPNLEELGGKAETPVEVMPAGSNSRIAKWRGIVDDNEANEEYRSLDPIHGCNVHSLGSTLNHTPSTRGRQGYHGFNPTLDICLTQEFVCAAGLPEVWIQALSNQSVVRLVDHENAEVVVSVDAKKNTSFMVRKQEFVKYGVQTLPTSCHASIPPLIPRVMPILTALFRWKWYLHLVPDSRPLQKIIDMEFFKLRRTGEYNDKGYPLLEPDGPNLNVDGVADFVLGDDDCYGVRIVNRSSQDLYVHLFDFCATDLAILQQAGPIDNPYQPKIILPKGSSCTIGYGSGGPPFTYILDEGAEFDVDILKVFVSADPINLRSLEQESPFEERGRVPDDLFIPPFGEECPWDAFELTLVQRRYPRGEVPATRSLEDISMEDISMEGNEIREEAQPTNSLSNVPQVLSSSTSVEEITALLCRHGYPDITTQLNLDECSNYPQAHGGSADIYRGCLRNGTKVAIKRSRTRVPNDENGRTCLRAMAKEGYIWSKHRHPNVLETCGVVRFQGGISLVAPWMENGTVMDYIRIQPSANRPKLCADIALGLAYLHQMGTAHDDLKGTSFWENVLVSFEGAAKLSDLEVPEILGDDGDMSAPADVYVLGMTILEVITGKPPFEHIRREEAVSAALFRGERPRRPESCISQPSGKADKLWDLLQLCWTTNPQDRPSAKDAVDITSPLDFSHGSSLRGLRDGSPTHSSNLVPSPGLRWDALHYLDVALYGTYAYEHQYAFSLGIPIVLRLVHWVKEFLLSSVFSPSSSGLMSPQPRVWLAYLVDTSLVATLAAQPCLALYKLTKKITHSQQFSYLTLMIHALMAAPPVIIRSAYAEPFFAWFTFEGLSAYHEQRYLVASLYFGLATAFRTNGILLPGFILYGLLVYPVLLALLASMSNSVGFRLMDILEHLHRAFRKLGLSSIIYSALLTVLSLSPFIAQQYIAYLTFCQSHDPRPWCSSSIPLIYSFVQSHYWDVGLWRYWTVAQIPNFMLAMPILTLTVSSIVWFVISSIRGMRLAREKGESSTLDLALSPIKALTLLPFALHALVLSLTLFTAAHVQIALRVLPATTPWVSWAGAALIIRGTRQKRSTEEDSSPSDGSDDHSWWPLLSHLWIGWSVIWLLVSSILWLAFLPPA